MKVGGMFKFVYVLSCALRHLMYTFLNALCVSLGFFCQYNIFLHFSLSLYYLSLYIYMCVCVCVC